MLPSLLAVGQNTTVRSNDTTSSFTPEANALLFVAASVLTAVSASVPNLTDTAGLSWATLQNQTFNGSTNRFLLWQATAPASPTAMTVSWSYGTAMGSRAWIVSQHTGYNTGAPLVSGSTAAAGATSSTPSTSVPALANAANVQVLWVTSRNATITAEAGWSTSTVTLPPATQNSLGLFYLTSPGDTSPSATLGGSSPWRLYAGEINVEDAGAVVGISTALRISRRRRR